MVNIELILHFWTLYQKVLPGYFLTLYVYLFLSSFYSLNKFLLDLEYHKVHTNTHYLMQYQYTPKLQLSVFSHIKTSLGMIFTLSQHQLILYLFKSKLSHWNIFSNPILLNIPGNFSQNYKLSFSFNISYFCDSHFNS